MIKTSVFRAAERVGALVLARRYTKQFLRILCYHGISRLDEHLFNPTVFMRIETFKRRMENLARLQYPVVSLDEALSGEVPENAVVITFDDGWEGTLEAAEVLHGLGFPSTLYASTYYTIRGTQVFNVLVRYLGWRVGNRKVVMSNGLSGELSNPSFQSELIRLGTSVSCSVRQAFADELCEISGVHKAQNLMRFLSPDQMRRLPQFGMDVQLHTHRHRFSTDDEVVNSREIEDNRDALVSIGFVRERLRHFCFPSGIFREEQLPMLSSQGIASAATCRGGLNAPGFSPLILHRILDSDAVSDVEFRATISGFCDVLKAIRGKLPPSRTTRILDSVEE